MTLPSRLFQFHDFSKLKPRDAYAWMVQLIVPRPIAWISTLNESGGTNLAPFSFFNGVCSNPPTLAVSITRKKDGSKKDTLRNIERTGEFVVNSALWAERDRINQTSESLPPEISEAELVGCTLLESTFVRPPRIGESLAQFECVIDRAVEIGDGAPGSATLVLGKIRGLHIDPALITEGKVDPSLLNPAARLGGSQWSSLGEILTLSRFD